MNFYFVGLTMRSETHDYTHIHRALLLLRARKVSHRVWMCAVEEEKSDHVFAMAKRCLAPEDQMIVAEVPSTMRPPKAGGIAA